MNFYITVLARKDVLNQITDKSLNGLLLIDYTDYNFTSGNDELASVKRNGVWGLTIHGPAEGSIILKMDPCRMIAETKASLVNQYARESQHPLLCEIESFKEE